MSCLYVSHISDQLLLFMHVNISDTHPLILTMETNGNVYRLNELNYCFPRDEATAAVVGERERGGWMEADMS